MSRQPSCTCKVPGQEKHEETHAGDEGGEQQRRRRRFQQLYVPFVSHLSCSPLCPRSQSRYPRSPPRSHNRAFVAAAAEAGLFAGPKGVDLFTRGKVEGVEQPSICPYCTSVSQTRAHIPLMPLSFLAAGLGIRLVAGRKD
eukprot:1134223-Pelagomonas_calceolata.AAC.2